METVKTKKLTFSQISKLQKENGFDGIQKQINDGIVWQLEGSQGRYAMGLLDSGACMLPTKPKRDYYNNLVPSRGMLQKGTKGTFQNSQNFWAKVGDGRIELATDENDNFDSDEDND